MKNNTKLLKKKAEIEKFIKVKIKTGYITIPDQSPAAKEVIASLLSSPKLRNL